MNCSVAKKINKGYLQDKIYIIIVYAAVSLFALLCFLPFWLVVVNSIVDKFLLNAKGYQIIVTKISFDAYKYLFEGRQIYKSYAISIFVTATGTALAVMITSMYGYVISHRKVRLSGIMAFMTYFTMILGSGLVGFYILIARWLHLKDSIWALILPYLLNPFLVFVSVSYFRSVPYEIYESATTDGANDIYIFFKIIFPVSKPIIATIIMFYALQYWNDWWLSLLFIDHDKNHSLQMMLRRLISIIDMSEYVAGSTQYIAQMPTESIKLATVCVTIGPIILLYPFIQKYFVKGIMIGAVKA